jgi:hypothetical protein
VKAKQTRMNINEFGRLPIDERTNYLWDNGTCLGQRLVDGAYILCIYALEDFFVEAIYSKNDNRVDAIRPISEIEKWNSYVDCTIRQLFQLS